MKRIQFEAGTHVAIYDTSVKKWLVLRGQVHIGSIDKDGECMYFEKQWAGHGYGDFDDFNKIMKQIKRQAETAEADANLSVLDY